MRPIITACLLLLAGSAGALAPGGQALSLYGGMAAPGGRVGDTSKLGFSGGATYRQQFTELVSGAVDGEFMRFGDQDIPGGIRTGADAMSFGALLRLDASGSERSHHPYLAAGPTLNRVTRRAQGAGVVDESTDDWSGGFMVALGTQVRLGEQLSLGPVARFRSFGSRGYAFAGGLELSFNLASNK